MGEALEGTSAGPEDQTIFEITEEIMMPKQRLIRTTWSLWQLAKFAKTDAARIRFQALFERNYARLQHIKSDKRSA